MKRVAVFCTLAVPLLLLALSCNRAAAPKYGLPITLGSTSDEVRKVLGGPTERYKVPERGQSTILSTSDIRNPDKNDRLLEWYYSSGIIGAFDRDRLTAITLNTYTDYQGFLAYTGTVVNGVTLADSKPAILKKLGEPTKVESDELDSGTNPDVPVVFPKESRYYWRFDDYLVEATFLNQAQSVDEQKHLTFPKDKLTVIIVRK